MSGVDVRAYRLGELVERESGLILTALAVYAEGMQQAADSARRAYEAGQEDGAVKAAQDATLMTNGGYKGSAEALRQAAELAREVYAALTLLIDGDDGARAPRADKRALLRSVLSAIVEDGVGVWGVAEHGAWIVPAADGPQGGEGASVAIVPSGQRQVWAPWPVDDDGQCRGVLTEESLRRAFESLRDTSVVVTLRTRARLLAAFDHNDASELVADDLDVLAQLAVFGRVIYP